MSNTIQQDATQQGATGNQANHVTNDPKQGQKGTRISSIFKKRIFGRFVPSKDNSAIIIALLGCIIACLSLRLSSVTRQDTLIKEELQTYAGLVSLHINDSARSYVLRFICFMGKSKEIRAEVIAATTDESNFGRSDDEFASHPIILALVGIDKKDLHPGGKYVADELTKFRSALIALLDSESERKVKANATPISRVLPPMNMGRVIQLQKWVIAFDVSAHKSGALESHLTSWPYLYAQPDYRVLGTQMSWNQLYGNPHDLVSAN